MRRFLALLLIFAVVWGLALPVRAGETEETADDALVRVADYISDIRQDLRYAGEDNFTGLRIYGFTDAYLRYGTVKKLAQVGEELEKQGLALLIWDAFRPISAQETLFQICPDTKIVFNPAYGDRPQCRGSAVDVTLVSLKTGEELAMPSDFEDRTPLADRDYTDCSGEAAANALLLEEVMTGCGFKADKGEWWSFTDTTAYGVELYFDPEVPQYWVGTGESVSLGYGGSASGSLAGEETLTLINWSGINARVSRGRSRATVRGSQIKPADAWVEEQLDTVPITDTYYYEQMLADMVQLEMEYDCVEVEIIGQSELGRDIPVLRIGDKNAEYHILLQGSIHGREHMTAWLLMAMADYWLDRDLFSYGDVCYHIIPMTNPDGVTISQTGELTEEQLLIYEGDKTSLTPEAYAARWKANGLGVDLNRNFPANWEKLEDATDISSAGYRGQMPFSAAETRVLRDYTCCYELDSTISYHASGSVIYYRYGSNKEVNKLSASLGKVAKTVTGYPLVANDGGNGGGYKDWVMDSLGIPSLTIEVGCGSAPLEEAELYSIFVRNFRVMTAAARWVQANDKEE